MNKTIPIILGTTAAAGTVGAVKYKQKKNMEREMGEAIMSVLPADLNEEERAAMAKSIIKGAAATSGLTKLAYAAKLSEVFLGEAESTNIFKEASEEFKEEIKSTVIEAIASVTEELLKEAPCGA